MIADWIAAGDHLGWNDFTYAATAEAWGHAIDVPVPNLYSPPPLFMGGGNPVIMWVPGAAISGCAQGHI